MAQFTDVELNDSYFYLRPQTGTGDMRFVLPLYSTPTGNPPTTSIPTGSIWLNTCVQKIGIAVNEQNPAWTSANSMNVTRRFGASAGASGASGLAAGGLPAAPGARTNASEEYNGTNWAACNAMTTARYFNAGAGSQNSAVAIGGNIAPSAASCCTEEYDGTSWSTVTKTPQTWNAGAAAGTTQNEVVTWGGGANTATTLEYNGNNYATANSTNFSANGRGGAGCANSALSFGTTANTGVTCTECYSGISWAAKAAAPVAMRNAYGWGADANASVAVGGRANAPANNTTCTTTRIYNGVTDTWSTGPAMPAGRFGHIAFGCYQDGGAWGGNNPATSTGARFCLSGAEVVKFKYLCLA
jgi:hypothetical protein